MMGRRTRKRSRWISAGAPGGRRRRCMAIRKRRSRVQPSSIRSALNGLLSANAFPAVSMSGYQGLGHGSASATRHTGQTANLTVSKFLGSHSLKMGADYRRIQAATTPPNTMSFGFTTGYTQGPNPNTASAAAGDAFASFLLGYPATGDFNTTTPGLYYLDYYSG